MSRSRSLRRLATGPTVLALVATMLGIGPAAPVAAQDSATQVAAKALNAMPKNASKPFDLVPLSEQAGDGAADYGDVRHASFDVAKLNKQGANFLNQRPPKVGEWWGANREPFKAGDRVLVFAAQTVAQWPGDAAGGAVWTVGQDGTGAFGYYGGGHADPYSGNAIVDDFGVFDSDGQFTTAGGRTSLQGLAPGGTPAYYGESGGVGYRKGRNSVAFLPVNQGAQSFSAALRTTVDGRPVYDYVGPGSGQHRHAWGGTPLLSGYDCYSVGVYPQLGSSARAPVAYDLQLSLGGSPESIENVRSALAPDWPPDGGPHWSMFPEAGVAYATTSYPLDAAASAAEALDAFGLTAAPIFDPTRRGFAAGDPNCGRRHVEVSLCGQGLDQIWKDKLGLAALPAEISFQFEDFTDSCAFVSEGAETPFAAMSVGSGLTSSEDMQRLRDRYEGCTTSDIDLGEDGFFLHCADEQEAMALIWRLFVGGPDGEFPYRASLEILDSSVIPSALESDTSNPQGVDDEKLQATLEGIAREAESRFGF